ncbi:MAG: DUF2946 family protein [Rubrivivax sp.]|nr:DUF2946 family protein [Rubrivivax sp.]
MDAIVEAALRKWPQVPHCYGWLALDARGDWYMRDERIQAAGPFPRVKGSVIRHEKLLGFIHRNYALDERGAAYFQNGPQRVYVELESTPWIWRVQASPGGTPRVSAHTGEPAEVKSTWLDEAGRLYLATALGFGLVHTLDMLAAADAVEAGHWAPQDCVAAELPARFGFCLQPQPPLAGTDKP